MSKDEKHPILTSVKFGNHLKFDCEERCSDISIDWDYVEKAVNYHDRLVAFLKMAAAYACVEGSEGEMLFTEGLLKDLGLDDDK